MLGASTGAHADRVDRLVRILRTDRSFKVRLQAAIGLGKLKAKRAVAPLTQMLRDRSDAMRGVAAAALGQIGDRTALSALRVALRKERKAFAKKQIRQAIEALRASAKKPRFFIGLGKITNNANLGDRSIADALGRALTRHFSRLPGVVTRWRGSAHPSARLLRRAGIRGFVLDAAVLQLSKQPRGGNVELSCAIRVSLATYPGNSMKAFYSGGAAMMVGRSELRADTESSLFSELVAGAAEGAKQQIVDSYLRTQ